MAGQTDPGTGDSPRAPHSAPAETKAVTPEAATPQAGGRGAAAPAGRGAAPDGGEVPRADTRGIVAAPSLMERVRFRRRLADPGLRRWIEHYWLIDWDLPEPYISEVVPHPCVNVVFERRGPAGLAPEKGLVSGAGTTLYSTKLEGAGRVCGAQFRPGGFHPFLTPPRPLTTLTDEQPPLEQVFPGSEEAATRVLSPSEEDERVAALDAFFLDLDPREDPNAERAMALAHRIRTDRKVLRVEHLAAEEGVSVRTLQRLFATYVGVSPKWVILRYRVHEVMEQATGRPATEWARLASDLGYSDQAHLVRDFTAAVGVPPSVYARAVTGQGSH